MRLESTAIHLASTVLFEVGLASTGYFFFECLILCFYTLVFRFKLLQFLHELKSILFLFLKVLW